jgi:NADPH2:quinone reductase
VSSTTSHEKAASAKAFGYEQVVDLSQETLSGGVMRITEGYGADIIIDAIGGSILSEALGTLAAGGSLTTLGYAADRKSTIDLTDLIWKGTSIKSFLLFSEPLSRWDEAWKAIVPLLKHGKIKPIVAREFSLEHAGLALQHLVDERPFGRVALKL